MSSMRRSQSSAETIIEYFTSKMLAADAKAGACTLLELPIPTPLAGELLIRNVFCASSGLDWQYKRSPIQGSEVAGYVAAVGRGVTAFAVGDRVAALTRIESEDRDGGYAEYSIAPESTTFIIGPNTKFEDAVAVPLCFTTAVLGLFRNMKLDLIEDATSPEMAKLRRNNAETTILVFGSGTTVGFYVTQLANKLGLGVLGVAGLSCEASKAIGCDIVLDRDSDTLERDLVDAVKEYNIKHAFDCVSDARHQTYELIGLALDLNGGGCFTSLAPHISRAVRLPRAVHHSSTRTKMVHIEGPAEKLASKYLKLAGEWLESGELIAQWVQIVPDGLAGVGEGLRKLGAGEVHCEKLVYRIADTPEIIEREKASGYCTVA